MRHRLTVAVQIQHDIGVDRAPAQLAVFLVLARRIVHVAVREAKVRQVRDRDERSAETDEHGVRRRGRSG